MTIEYKQNGDYLLPNLGIENINNNGKINRFGYLRLNYLKENNKALYTTLLMKNKLTNHLISVSQEAENMFNYMMNYCKKIDSKLSENNKKTNQIKWVKLMNNYKNIIEGIILNELIYK